MLQSLKEILLYGFLTWLIPFFASLLMFPIRVSSRDLFESIMPVISTICVVFFSIRYFRKAQANVLAQGILVGIVWLAISTAIDLLIYLEGPLKTTLDAYVRDIGLTHLIIPVITVGFAYVIRERNRRSAEATLEEDKTDSITYEM